MSRRKKAIIVTSIVIIIGVAAILLGNKSDDTSPTLYVSKETAQIGGDVYVTVSAKNNPGISGFVLDMEYDEQKLTPLEITRGDIISQGLFDSNLDTKAKESPVKITWFDISDVIEGGDLYTIKFKVSGKEKGRVPITLNYEDGNIANQSLDIVDFKLKDAYVTIKN